MAEIPFEYMLLALETTRGTAVNPPTHYLNVAGQIVPRLTTHAPAESWGTLAARYRSAVTHKSSEWSGEGPADVNILLPLLAMAVKSPPVTTTPGGGSTTRLHTYTPTMTADNLKSATLYWGDPNIQTWQADYCMLDELTISGDASGDEVVRMSVKGHGHFPTKTAPSSLPAQSAAPLLAPSDMQLWINEVAVAGRLISAEVTIPTGVTYKNLASGIIGGLEYASTGRDKRNAEMKLVLELPDMTQYDQWATHVDGMLTRLRFNGPLLEGALRAFIEIEMYGPFDSLDWGENQSSNRTIGLNILSEYNRGTGYDFQVAVQNTELTAI